MGAIAELKNEKHIPMRPKDGMTVEKVSLAALADLGVIGLASLPLRWLIRSGRRSP
jgi:hypothetical protein